MLSSSTKPVPFRFSVAADGAKTATDWLELARKAEALGFDSLAVTDHIQQAMAPVTALAAAAMVTTTLRLGTYVLGHDFRSPVVLAKELATLDVISGGRVEVGLGAGWQKLDYAQAGIPFSSGSQRFARFTEYVQLVSELLMGSSVTRAGGHFPVTGVTCVPDPVQQPIPMLIGGSRRKTVEFAAKWADTVSIAPATGAGGYRLAFWDADIDHRVNWVRATAAGRACQPEIDLAIHECWVLPRPEALIERLSAGREVPADKLDSIPSFLVGSAGHVTDLLLARRERWGASRVTIPASAVDMMAPVVARLAGT